jgi:hypothetical protein
MPSRFVSDPKIEVSDLPDMKQLVEAIRQEKGEASIIGLNEMIAERMRAFSMATRSFLDNMLHQMNETKNNNTVQKPQA